MFVLGALRIGRTLQFGRGPERTCMTQGYAGAVRVLKMTPVFDGPQNP